MFRKVESEFNKLIKQRGKRQRVFNNNREMAQINMEQLIQQMASLHTALQAVQQENRELRTRLEQIPINPAVNNPQVENLETRVAVYNNPNEINLEIFKSLPTFDGAKNNYRLWREDATRLMNSISQHSNSNRYVEALTIVKSKITGAAANILLNHNTIFNFEAILNRLDYTYCDQRPLYVLKDELTKITQGKLSLSEFHDEVSKALTVVTSKLSMSGDPPDSIKCMTSHAMEDAVRTFKNGINNEFIRSTLYGNPVKDLEHAYAIAQTIEHDNNHKNLLYKNTIGWKDKECTQQSYKNQHTRRPSYYPKQHQQHQQQNNFPKPEPMDTSSGNTRNFNNARQQYNQQGFHSQPWKRIRDQSGNFQQAHKVQKHNQIKTQEEDNISTTTEKSSKCYRNKSSIKNLKLIDGLYYIFLKDEEDKEYKIFIDCGATHNYINKKLIMGKRIRTKPLRMISIHGESILEFKQRIKLFNKELEFYELENDNDYDLMLGVEGLTQLDTVIDIREKLFIVPEKIQKINYSIGDQKFALEIEQLMNENNNIGPLPFTTTIEASIRTTTNEPIWTKQYPSNFNDTEFVNKEIKKLLEQDIIQKSYSPYNSPMLTVHKKGLDENGKPKRRMVIDFRKLNEHTITDRYIIPDVNITLQNLGSAKYFTTLDLESGFHQIKIKREDREKTAFCVNGGKYEFKRMPFGLKNAPSIFQRCVDDILREFIGKFVYVYIDDVLIFSSSPEEHLEHIHTVFEALNKATLKVSDEKSKFFMTEVEYLGHVIKHNKITTDPEKIKAIENFPIPTTLKDLRGFLGLTGYYRRFVRNYAQITKPLTVHLKGENAHVGKNKSSNTKINLDKAAIEAVNLLKLKLREQVELFQPNFDKPLELTTDASNIAIGAVLSQNKKPIYFLSRTLSTTEQNYSTNEKELLAIIWALQKLRNYIYGIADLTIFTDHQSLTYAISEKNPNPKLKRWKAIIEDYGAKIKYKPGTENVVADALSRQIINTSSIDTEHSAESSASDIIKTVTQSFNTYGIQLELVPTPNLTETRTRTIFHGKVRHTINFANNNDLISELKKILVPNRIVAIHMNIEDLYQYAVLIKETFLGTKFVHTPKKLKDVTDRNDQLRIIEETHLRAHRSYVNITKEILEKYYWPTIKKDSKQFNNHCPACLFGRYERNPTNEPLRESDIPTQPREYIHADIYFNDNNTYLVTIDKFSKYIVAQEINTKAKIEDKIEEIIINNFPECKRLMTDNEASFVTPAFKQMCIKHSIQKIETPVHRSKANGQVERAHNSISELTRIFKIQNSSTVKEEIFRAIKELNNSIHTVTGFRPREIYFGTINYSKEEIIRKLRQASNKVLERLNKKSRHRTFEKGTQILVKITGIRKKNQPRYKKEVVEEDRGDTILTRGGKTVHKNNIKNITIKEHDTNIPDISRAGNVISDTRSNNSNRKHRG